MNIQLGGWPGTRFTIRDTDAAAFTYKARSAFLPIAHGLQLVGLFGLHASIHWLEEVFTAQRMACSTYSNLATYWEREIEEDADIQHSIRFVPLTTITSKVPGLSTCI